MSDLYVTDDRRSLVLTRLPYHLVFIAAFALLGVVSACSDNSTSPASVQTIDEAIDQTIVETVVQPEGEPSQTSADMVEDAVIDDSHANTLHSIRFTDSNLDIWPPQPKDISDVAVIPPSSSDTEANTDLTLKKNPAIYKLPGTRHETLTRLVLDDKSGNNNRIAMEIFDYNKNQIITVEFNEDGTEIIHHSANDAALYQPPESPAEVARAIELAASDLTRQGFTEHTNLIGTGLLAFPSAVQSAADNTYFFKARKIYVTFGIGNGELPQYRALVNLSTNTVESSGSIQ